MNEDYRKDKEKEAGHSSPPRGGVASGAPTGPGAEGGSTPNFVDNGGLILQNVRVHLIFWGTSWSTLQPPTMGSIIDAVENILTGPYMSALSQYRNIIPGSLNGVTLVTGPVGSSAANPPNPFSDNNISGLIADLINAGRVPAPSTDSQLFYCVILPTGTHSAGGSFVGEHTYFSYSGINVHFAWITNNGTLDNVTSIFSHELVETCTDPEGTAITGTPGTCTQGGWCEIGDVCYSYGNLNGVTVQAYWSQRDGKCIIPTAKDAKDGKDTKDTKDNKEHKEHKESKDTKDHKDHKELKDGAKEKDKDAKEKDHKEKDIETPFDISSTILQVSQRLDNVEQQVNSIKQNLGIGKAFIQPEERPPVGGGVVKSSGGDKKEQ